MLISWGAVKLIKAQQQSDPERFPEGSISVIIRRASCARWQDQALPGCLSTRSRVPTGDDGGEERAESCFIVASLHARQVCGTFHFRPRLKETSTRNRLVSCLLLQAFRQHSEIEDYFAIKQPSKERNESTTSGWGETLVSSHTQRKAQPDSHSTVVGYGEDDTKSAHRGDAGRKRCRKPFLGETLKKQ